MNEVDITYVSSSGVAYPLVATNFYIKEASIHEYEWEPEVTKFKYGDLVKLFTKASKRYNVTLAFNGSLASKEQMLKEFHDETERDIMTESAGKLTYNGYEIPCYIISSKVYPNDSNSRTYNDVIFYCPYPFWIKETKYSISLSGKQIIDGANFKLNLPMNLGISGYQRVLNVDSSIPYDFRMVIHGACSNPEILINGHKYNVNTNVPTSVDLVINALEKTDVEKSIYLQYPSGNTINVFNLRNRDFYIFEPIIGKTIMIESSQAINFDLYLIERRSEPQWI